MQRYPHVEKLVLASSSPRRRELLASLGLEFTTAIPQIDEVLRPGENPRAYAERLAGEKAEAVAADPETTVLGADTIVVQGGGILGKPADAAQAFEMLAALSGKTHEVITAVCIRRGPRQAVFSVSTEVLFRELDVREIEAYIASGCPMDKAGAYAIQGGAAHMVRAINGSYTNVVGLPLCELHEVMNRFD